MKPFLLFSVPLLLACLAATGYSGQQLIGNLKCEYLVNPIGIDEKSPRLCWQMLSSRPGARQRGFQIFVATSPEKAAAATGDVWDSGTQSGDLVPVVYQGPPLEPFTRYHWAVKIQDETGAWSDVSPIAFFETGMMDSRNWKGDWITDTQDYSLKPAPYFRHAFSVQKKIQSARVYIAVAGLYELYVNGEKIGDQRLDPMYTRFDRRTLYVTHDVTKNLTNGENVVGVLLGNGWYNHQSTAVWLFDKAPWRSRPKFCLDLHIRYTDGSMEIVRSNDQWKTALSPIIFNSIYTAEHYDARREQPGWNRAGFDDAQWKEILRTNAPSNFIIGQAVQPIRNVEEIHAVEMIRQDERTWLYNFGRNLAGVTQIRVSGAAGTTLRLKHAERLDSRGRADLSNIEVHYRPTDDQAPFQTDIFILSGKGEESFMPRFNYKGFQYVEVTSDRPVTLTKESLTAYFMHSDVPVAGAIQSANPLLNIIWKAVNTSYLSNLFGYPTDCPQREKNGWTGDAHVNSETGLYNFDAITVYEKWLADHRDEQQPNGVLGAIIPSNGWGYHWANGPDWTSTIAIIPWTVYLFYGDIRSLANCYDNIKRYVDHIDELYPSGITDWGLGDWIPVKSKAPKEFTSSIYYYVDADILAKAAGLLGKQADAERYTALAEKIKNAINAKYLDRRTGLYGSGLQTELSCALKWGIVPKELIDRVAKNLSDRVIADNRHVDVGMLGSKAILNALSENGYADLAYQVASQESFPSWGWWIVNGATTFPENWVLDAKQDISLNHIMFGEISAWYYKALAGILPDETQPGFKRILLKPNFVAGLDHFEAMHEGPYGTIRSSWKKSGNTVDYTVAIPANSHALLQVRAREIRENGKPVEKNPQITMQEQKDGMIQLALAAGVYTFRIKL